jgi:hypothetical protein
MIIRPLRFHPRHDRRKYTALVALGLSSVHSPLSVPQRLLRAACYTQVIYATKELAMTIALDDATRKKLVLVRQLYEQSLRQSSPHTSIMDRIMSVIVFDLAIETALKAAAIAMDPAVKRKDLSNNLITSCEKVFQAKGFLFPPMGNMLKVRDVRNDAQHEARYPNDTDLNDCRVYGRDILNHILSNVWGESLDTISLADLIQHDRTKQYFIRSEQALSVKDYAEAAMHAMGGFHWALESVRDAFVGREPMKRDMELLSSGVERMVDRMRTTLLYQSLGINYADTVRLNQQIGEVLLMASGRVELVRREGMAPIDRPLAESTISYCVDAVVRIEQRVGDLSAPFGVKHWF